MKKILFAILVFALAGSASAQKHRKGQNQRHDQNHRKENLKQEHRHRHQLRENLNLTNEQSAQLKAINQDFRQKMEDLRNQQLTVKERNEKRHELQKQHVDAIQGVLTAEQKEQLAKSKKEHKEKIADERKKKAKNVSKDLNLTDEQRQRLTQLRESYKAKAEALRSDNILTKEQKRQGLEELMRQQREEMKTILTAEQIRQLELRRAAGKKRK